MKTKYRLVVTAFTVLIAVLMSGCAGMSRDEAQFTGFLGGAVVGSQFGKGTGKGVATLVGGVVGAQVADNLRTQGSGVPAGYHCEADCGNVATSSYESYNPGVESARALGASQRLKREQKYEEWRAFCSEDPDNARCRRGWNRSYGAGVIGNTSYGVSWD